MSQDNDKMSCLQHHNTRPFHAYLRLSCPRFFAGLQDNRNETPFVPRLISSEKPVCMSTAARCNKGRSGPEDLLRVAHSLPEGE